MITVVDAFNFLRDYGSSDYLADRGETAGEGDHRSVVDLLIEQVEFADVIVLNKADLVSAQEMARLRAILSAINPQARLIEAQHGAAPLDAIFDTGLYDPQRAALAPGWQKALIGEVVPETEEFGISNFVYRADRPFDPTKLHYWFRTEWPGVLRSKGFFWLATQHDRVASWSQAGPSTRVEIAGRWWATAPKSAWPDDPRWQAAMAKIWRPRYGDRRQEIVLIGQNMDRRALEAGFDACLLSKAQFALGPQAWAKLSDPFPASPQGAPAH
jgi:G3E family GTPase